MCTGARSCPLGLLGCNLSFIHYQRVASFSLTASFSARRVQSSDVAPPPAALPVKSSPNYPKALKPAKTGPFPAPYSPDLPRVCASAYPPNRPQAHGSKPKPAASANRPAKARNREEGRSAHAEPCSLVTFVTGGPIGAGGTIGTMPRVKVDAWQCGACGHVWLVGADGVKPPRCARCKARSWDRETVAEVERQPVPARVVKAPAAVGRIVAEVREEVKLKPRSPGLTTLTAQRPAHDPQNCRVYRCGLCAGAGHHDPLRGL